MAAPRRPAGAAGRRGAGFSPGARRRETRSDAPGPGRRERDMIGVVMNKVINPVAGALLLDPKRVGGWHHAAIRVGDLVFLSGIVGAYPGTRRLGETTEKQVRLIFENADEALRAHGATIRDVVRMTMYFTDREATWPVLDRVRREVFPEDPPTSTGVGVTKLDLDAALEIEMIALAGSSG